MVRPLTFFALLSARASLGKMTGFKQLRHSPFFFTSCSFLLCGNPLNIPHPYKGCLADLQAMQVSSTLVVMRASGEFFSQSLLSNSFAHFREWCSLLLELVYPRIPIG